LAKLYINWHNYLTQQLQHETNLGAFWILNKANLQIISNSRK